MSDIKYTDHVRGCARLLRDMGDGTHAEVVASGSGLLGTVGVPTRYIDEADNDSSKTFTVPEAREWEVMAIHVNMSTSATVGTRQLSVVFLDADGQVVAEQVCGVTQAASLLYLYNFAPGMPDLTAVRYSINVTTPLPPMVLPAGWKVKVFDKAAIDAAADDMKVYLTVRVRAA